MASIQHHRHLLGASTDTPPTTEDHPLTTQDPNFNSNMVIVLAALLCALVCALALNSIFRCAMRCGVFRLGQGGGGWGDESAAGEGLNKAELSKIPVEEYRGGAGEGECPICLAEYAEGEKVRVLPKCNHGFHVSCVDKWLASHSSCPTCRQQLVLLQQPNNNSSGDISTLSVWI